MAAEKREVTLVHLILVVRVYLFSCLGKIFCCKFLLCLNKTLNQWTVLLEHLVGAAWHGTRDDEWCTCIVNEHRVDLVDNRVVVHTLYKVAWLCSHVVAQVVETELVVCTECNVGQICLAALVRVGTVLVNAVNAQTVEHVERPHPLRVTLCKVVVHCNHVYTVACEGIQEYRKCSNQGLTLTGCHLGNLSLVQYNTTEQLYIIVYHVPHSVVAACLPVVAVDGLVAVNCHKVELCCKVAVGLGRCYNNLLVLGKTACAILYNGKSLGQCLVESLVKLLKNLFLKLVYLRENCLAFFQFYVFNACLKLFNLGAFCSYRTLYLGLECCRSLTQTIIAQCRYRGICGLDLLDPRLNLLHVAARLVSKNLAYKFVKTHMLYFFILCPAHPVCAITCKDNDKLSKLPYITAIKFSVSHLSSCKKRAKAGALPIFGRFCPKTAILKLKYPIFAKNILFYETNIVSNSCCFFLFVRSMRQR